MDYRQALDYILSFTDYEKAPAISYAAANFDLARMEGLLSLLGDPHRGRPTVHIAGTKGKGSVAAMVASVLRAAGHRTGLPTSPHLHSFRERIRIDGQLIAPQELATLVAEIKPQVEAINAQGEHGQLTTFEIITALGFLYFQRLRAQGTPEEILADEELLHATNLLHQHLHRHHELAHLHPHRHHPAAGGHAHDH